ncbi:MAG: hypothetical protein PHV82_09700, partial [Victivallaceae bacterium]|nr:hypothetical protein [Victivallaceae bacterium]
MLNKKHITTLGILAALGISFQVRAVNIMKYLPRDARLDGSVDYRAEIQKALDENETVELAGSGNPAKPLIYGVKIPRSRIGLTVPEGHTLIGSSSAVIKRIPSAGSVLLTQKGVRIKGIIIDGNKKAHWPEFEDLGKGDMGIRIGPDNLIESCSIYDMPGTAFATSSDGSVIRNCKARNVGYIDLKYSSNRYIGKLDRWSGDGFYIRGHKNLVIDCCSEDAFRWDYTTCHGNVGDTLFINCKGRDVLWKTYGFIDIEACDGKGSTMINCKSPDGSIAISTSDSKLIGCTAHHIDVHAADNIFISGCETLGGGLAVGGWCSLRKSYVRGGANPIVINNVINRNIAEAGVPGTSDWSLSVFSTDGKGIVAGNLLNEYENGPGMKFDKVKAYDNLKKYGRFKLPQNSAAEKIKRQVEAEHAVVRFREFGRE